MSGTSPPGMGEKARGEMGQSGQRHKNAEKSERVVNVMKRHLYIWCRVLVKNPQNWTHFLIKLKKHQNNLSNNDFIVITLRSKTERWVFYQLEARRKVFRPVWQGGNAERNCTGREEINVETRRCSAYLAITFYTGFISPLPGRLFVFVPL